MFHERLREYSKTRQEDTNLSDLTVSSLFNSRSEFRFEENTGKLSRTPSIKSNNSSTKTEYIRNLRNLNSSKKKLTLEDILFEEINTSLFKENSNNTTEKNKLLDFKNSEKFNSKKIDRRKLISYKYYDILGLRPHCSINEVKKSYRTKVTKLHPDKIRTKNEELERENTVKFQEIQKAYELLSNPNKKEVYDEYGDDILRYGFFDNWNEMKGLFETKKKKKPSDIACENNNEIHWQVFWQNLLLEVFFKPILRKNCIELRDLNQMNISVLSYKQLIENAYKYLKNLNNIFDVLFDNPIHIKLDIHSITNDKSLTFKKNLFSRLSYELNEDLNTENLENKYKNLVFFNNTQIIGRVIDTASDNNSETDQCISSNIENIKNAHGIVFCENKDGWIKLIDLAKKEYNLDLNNHTSNNFKRRVKDIQSKFDWIILIFLSEEQLPNSDQELLLDLYNYKDNELCEINENSKKEVIESKINFQLLRLFPCVLLKPRNCNPTGDFSYLRPTVMQINMVIKQLELLSQLDEESLNNKVDIFEMIKC